MTTLRGIDVFTGRPVALTLGASRITAVESLEIDAEELPLLSPGWLDLQVNGWNGVDYNGDTVSLAEVETLCRSLARRGTTRHLATVITAGRETLIRRLSRLRDFRETSPWVARRIPGFHVEGPYISGKDGTRGAHDAGSVRDPDVEEFESWQEAAGGLIRIVTLAPERPGALEFIEAVTNTGVTVSLGHTSADPGRIREAVAAGARLSTHLGNGLARSIDRHGNPLWVQLADDTLTSGLITDGHHLPDAFIRTAYRTKGPSRIVLTSDAAVPGGRPPGNYAWAGTRVEVGTDGRIALAGTPYLAGAGHLLDTDLPIFVRATGAGWAEAVSCVTRIPGKFIGIPAEEFALAPGAGADIVAFRPETESSSMEIEKVLVEGAEP